MGQAERNNEMRYKRRIDWEDVVMNIFFLTFIACTVALMLPGTIILFVEAYKAYGHVFGVCGC